MSAAEYRQDTRANEGADRKPSRAGAAGASSNAHERHRVRLQERIDALTEEARRMSRVLPRAMAMTSHGAGLAEAMAPVVERSIGLSGKRDPRPLAEALFPVIGAALRRACTDGFRRSFMALNRFMLCNCSFKGYRMRAEARRARRSFYDVLAEHTRTLPVQQVFLIHRETGTLLLQVQSQAEVSRDWDLVSGMLTALTDFIHDSFGVEQSETLETFRVGELTVIIEQGRHAALAGIVRGDIPEDLRDRFRQALGAIHAEFAQELAVFEGESAVFEPRRERLTGILRSLVSRDRTRVLPQTVAVVVVPIVALLVWTGMIVRERYLWNAFIEDLASKPGIVVIDEGKKDGRYFVHGLRDPMAVEPLKLMFEHGLYLDDVDSRWALYQALHSQLTLPRLRQMLDPPDGIDLELVDGMLIIRGSASQDWIDGALSRLRGLTGMGGYRTEDLIVSDQGDNRYWDRYLKLLEKEPGIFIMRSGRRDGRFFVAGLRDPLARDPERLLETSGLEPEQVDSRWEPYQALHPTLILARARQVLLPPETVLLEMRAGNLVASGRAPHAWIAQSEAVARSIAGVNAFLTERLVDEDLERLAEIESAIERQVFRFLVGAPDLWPGQGSEVEAFLQRVNDLKTAAGRADKEVRIEIRGHTDASGDDPRDQRTSEALAQGFYDNLRWRGVDVSVFTRQGMGARPPANLNDVAREALNRLVSFDVVLRDR